jgi:membrane-bound ClpP family serine protease
LRSRPFGQEEVGFPIEQHHNRHPEDLAGRGGVPDLTDHCHRSHRFHLHVDDDDFRLLVGECGYNLGWVLHLNQGGVSVDDGRPDIVHYPGCVGDEENLHRQTTVLPTDSALVRCPLVRRLIWLLALASAFACQTNGTAAQEAPIEVLEISGPLDDAVLSFLLQSIEQAPSAGRELIVIELSSVGAVGSRAKLAQVADVLARPPVPVVVWVGPLPAIAYGGSVQLLSLAPLSFAAPGSEVGLALPTLAGSGDQALLEGATGISSLVTVAGPISGVVDEVHPSLQNLLQALDGRLVDIGGTVHTLSTLEPTEGGITTRPVAFSQPGLGWRTLRLAVRPEAAFFFLVAGLTVAVFEFYAIGPGIAAGVAGASLLLAGYGIVVLPVRPLGVILALLGWFLFTWSYQRGTVVLLTVLGATAMTIGGLSFTDAAPQIEPHPVGVIASVLAILFFYLLALPTVARARFSTPAIGRQRLVGKEGTAGSDFSPEGVAVIDGARWRATAHRESGLRAGDPVRVIQVDGSYLEVEPFPKGREN